MTDKTAVKRRKRGVKASRVKLEKALINAGFTTQAALAKHIAEIEGTDSIPKDIVNRVFREVSVSPHTLERVANVLGVEAYTLYLTNDNFQAANMTSNNADNEDNSHDILKVTANKPTYTPYWKYSSITVALLVFWASIFFILQIKKVSNENTLIKLQTLIPSLGPPTNKYSLALRSSPSIESTAEKLKALLKKDFNVVPRIYKLDENSIQTENIERSSQVDMIINMQLFKLGRFWLVESSILKYPNKVILARKLLTKSEWLSLGEEYTKQVAHTLNTFIQKGYTQLPNETLPSLEYLTLIGEGLSLLDESSDFNKIKQAQSKFLLAKDINETLSLAKAGICLTYLYESWTGDEKTLLTRASQHCEEAKQGEENSIVATANGFLLRRTGRLTQAYTYVEQQLNQMPESVDLLIEKGNILLELFRQTGKSNKQLELAKKSLQQASLLAPNLWKSYFTLGLVEWTLGHQRAAIEATSVAANLTPNDLVLSNMATLSFCIGDIEPTKAYVQQILLKQPDSYLGLEKMSMLHYYANDFQAAIHYRLKSIANAGESSIHEMWGALADAYHFNGNIELSIQTYEKALQIIDREYARGNQNLSHQAFRLYYQIKQHILDNKQYPLNESVNTILLSLAKQHNTLDSSTIARIALSFFYMGEDAYANKYKHLASTRCPVYLQLPDWQ